jgi:hypothetical protein
MKVKGYMYPQMKKPVGMLVYTGFWGQFRQVSGISLDRFIQDSGVSLDRFIQDSGVSLDRFIQDSGVS